MHFEFGFRLNAFSDVVVDADHRQRLAFGVTNDHAVGLQRANLAVRPDNAELRIQGPFTLQCQFHFCAGRLNVVRMHALLPCLVHTPEVLRVDSVEPEHPVVPFERVRGWIQFPDPDAG